MEAFNKLLLPGVGLDGDVWIEVKWTGVRLSITGVEGPKRNGDCRGGAGQCREALDTDRIRVTAPWTYGMVKRLQEIWNAWHLNDMKAGCEHQRAEGWDTRPIDPTKPTNAYGKHYEGQTYDSWNMLTWVRPDEYPEGLMTVPCPTCGYRYGTAWLTEEVPEDVLVWLSELPETDKTYPWEASRFR